MSKFRCQTDISFDNENDAVAFLNFIQEIKGKIFKGAGGEEIPIVAKVEHHECFHDENPPKPCGKYTNYDLRKVEVEEVKTKVGVKIDAADLLK